MLSKIYVVLREHARNTFWGYHKKMKQCFKRLGDNQLWWKLRGR